jgi:hypothetical protein
MQCYSVFVHIIYAQWITVQLDFVDLQMLLSLFSGFLLVWNGIWFQIG